MKTKFVDWRTIELDLSDKKKEVSDYVLDQIEDRFGDIGEVEFEIEKDYEKQKITIIEPIVDLAQRIIEEKEADIEFEEKASQ